MKHFVHQVAFINQIVPPPWKICFGNLGTGIIGVQPQVGSSSSSSAPAVVKQEVKEEGLDDDDDGLKDANSTFQLPSDATIALLINGPSSGFLTSYGNSVGGYDDTLNVEGKSMIWTSQRGDRFNKRISAIYNHSQNGGRVAVGIRDSISGADGSASFKLLGFVSRIDELKEAEFLVKDGDHLIAESGRRIVHKHITASCLDAGLKAGIGLTTKRYPLPANSTEKLSFCCKCCYVTPTCRLHFEELKEEGVLAYKPFSRHERKRGRSVKEELETVEEDWSAVPRRRLRFKQELTDGHSCIKSEPEERKPEESALPSACEALPLECEQPALPPAQSRSDLDDSWEPPDPPSLDAGEVETLDSCLGFDKLDTASSLEVGFGQERRFTASKELNSSAFGAYAALAAMELD
jgi:hypothetical protein